MGQECGLPGFVEEPHESELVLVWRPDARMRQRGPPKATSVPREADDDRLSVAYLISSLATDTLMAPTLLIYSRRS